MAAAEHAVDFRVERDHGALEHGVRDLELNLLAGGAQVLDVIPREVAHYDAVDIKRQRLLHRPRRLLRVPLRAVLSRRRVRRQASLGLSAAEVQRDDVTQVVQRRLVAALARAHDVEDSAARPARQRGKGGVDGLGGELVQPGVDGERVAAPGTRARLRLVVVGVVVVDIVVVIAPR